MTEVIFLLLGQPKFVLQSAQACFQGSSTILKLMQTIFAIIEPPFQSRFLFFQQLDYAKPLRAAKFQLCNLVVLGLQLVLQSLLKNLQRGKLLLGNLQCLFYAGS